MKVDEVFNYSRAYGDGAFARGFIQAVILYQGFIAFIVGL